ncbi:transporter [Algimonas arctica]|uniref:Transporter n=1 Tax=Algimonas arctica TaxID=1479486 RepID=A0A8J3CQQ8_9PROT|nr:EamA family transporter [Algimonas arctica]GHA85370.1 transporter [Algimonas arctica]
MGYFYIAGCIAFTVYGQIVLKWRMNQNLDMPDSTFGKIIRLVTLILTDPWIFSGLTAAFVASLFWMMAMTKFQISYAYPFMSSAFVLVLLISVPLFGETLNAAKLGGTALIILGIIVLSRGYAA